MGRAGKILAILNVLAAIGFLCLAVMDYGKQRAWTNLIFQEDLLLNGLPTDDKELDANGEIVANKIGKYALSQILTGNPPVVTQLAEVLDRQNKARAAVDQAGDDTKKRVVLSNLLLPLASTYGEREELKRQINGDPIDQLMGDSGPFKAAFREALEGSAVPVVVVKEGEQAGPHPLGYAHRRLAIAHLLYNLGDKPENYDQRLQGIIGLKAFAQEVAHDVAINQHLLSTYQAVSARELADFENRHRSTLLHMLSEAERIQWLRDRLQKVTAKRDVHKELIQKRLQNVAHLEADLEHLKTVTAAALARQKDLEDRLQSAEKSIASTSAENLQLERQIRSREQTR